MKFLIASDIHGSAYWAGRLMDEIARQQPDRVLLLGDLLYHGPRNDLPRDYAPKRVIPLLNDLAADGRVVAVRGNCEAEVDQMVLTFPCMADSTIVLDDGGRQLFCTHGHVYGAGFHNSVDNLPALPDGSAIVYGHTHVKVNEAVPAHPGIWAFNPGSVSIPKDGTHSYGLYDSTLPVAEAFSHVVMEEE
ncbi:phosphodiesterase [Collinsella tanakaei]|uniref:phosphodiesterase n=1 Tax=Collinsella tanakaei TaxID=626935 RepID=UPI0019571218|nr:phosphodiesterase [Collinsella tanakaei]MBM6755795.1 phosphodiesterase [Collinsella tanakaei]MBM6868613.1 phosphodiesterase [Collinsella tanakaei]